MMDREWAGVLARYGQRAVLHREGGSVEVRAFLQPIREKNQAQRVPSPLGLRREDRFLYLGPPNQALGPDCWVECGGAGYEVQSAHPVEAGGEISHTWAVLRPRDREGET